MAERREGRPALKREWTVQEILDQMALCVDDDHCAEHCAEEPCVLQDTAFLCSIARVLETQQAEIKTQRQTNELDELMESICDRCCYSVEADGQYELDDICAGCTIREEIEHLMNQ